MAGTPVPSGQPKMTDLRGISQILRTGRLGGYLWVFCSKKVKSSDRRQVNFWGDSKSGNVLFRRSSKSDFFPNLGFGELQSGIFEDPRKLGKVD